MATTSSSWGPNGIGRLRCAFKRMDRTAEDLHDVGIAGKREAGGGRDIYYIYILGGEKVTRGWRCWHVDDSDSSSDISGIHVWGPLHLQVDDKIVCSPRDAFFMAFCEADMWGLRI